MTEMEGGTFASTKVEALSFVAALCLLVFLVLGLSACSDEDLFVPGSIPIPPTSAATQTSTPDDS